VKTVVTGAAGWLGSALLEALGDESSSLRCLVRSTEEAELVRRQAPKADVVVGDVRDPVALASLLDDGAGAVVVHAASVIHPSDGVREFFDVNVGGTALLLDEARRAGAGRVVYVSSNSPFGFNPSPDDRFDEDAPYNPYLGYGQSKMEAERLVTRAGASGLDTVIVRCPWFYGEHQPQRQTSFFTMVRRGIFPMCGNGSNRRSMVYTGNLAQGLVLAARSAEAAGRAYWVADPEPYRMTEILSTVKHALTDEGLSVSARQVRLPAATSAIAGLGDRMLQATNRYSAQLHVLSEMSRTIACSTDRAQRELGYRPEVDLYTGMRRSIRWCLDQGWDI
jgi:nucleoside-diphosphate-sugar epimerase